MEENRLFVCAGGLVLPIEPAMEQTRMPAERAARSEKLIYIRREDAYRQALQKPRSFQLSLNSADMLASELREITKGTCV